MPQYKLMAYRPRTGRLPSAWASASQWTQDLDRVKALRDEQQAAHPDKQYKIMMLAEVHG